MPDNPENWRDAAKKLWSLTSEGDLADVRPIAFARNAGWNYIKDFEDRRAKIESLTNHPEESRTIEDFEVLFCGKLDECLFFLGENVGEEDSCEAENRREFIEAVYSHVRQIAEDMKRKLAPAWSQWRIKTKVCRERIQKGRIMGDEEKAAARNSGETALKEAMSTFQGLFRELHPLHVPIWNACQPALSMLGKGMFKPAFGEPNGLLSDRDFRKHVASCETQIKPIEGALTALCKDFQPDLHDASETGRLLAALVTLSHEHAEAVTACCARLEKKKKSSKFRLERKHATNTVVLLQNLLNDFVSADAMKIEWAPPKFRLPDLGVIDFPGIDDIPDPSGAFPGRGTAVTVNMANFVQGDLHIENRVEAAYDSPLTLERLRQLASESALHTAQLEHLLEKTVALAANTKDNSQRSGIGSQPDVSEKLEHIETKIDYLVGKKALKGLAGRLGGQATAERQGHNAWKESAIARVRDRVQRGQRLKEACIAVCDQWENQGSTDHPNWKPLLAVTGKNRGLPLQWQTLQRYYLGKYPSGKRRRSSRS